MVSPAMVSRVIMAYDATKDRHEGELQRTLDEVRLRGDILHGRDRLIVLGVLHRVPHPMGYQTIASIDAFGGTNMRAIEEEVSKKVNLYIKLLQESAQLCEDAGIQIEVKIAAGNPTKNVILQEVVASSPSWIILDRHLRRDLKFYLQQLPCKVSLINDNLSVDVLRSFPLNAKNSIENKVFITSSKLVHPLNNPDSENVEQSVEQSVTSCGSYPPQSFSSSVEISNFPRPDSENIDQSVISCQSYPPQSFSTSMESSGISNRNITTNESQKRNFQLKEDVGSSFKQENSGRETEKDNKYLELIKKQSKKLSRLRASEAPILCAACGTRTELNVMATMKFDFKEIQRATNGFAKENLLGEGGFGHVYKGKLKDGQVIATKVRKEESTQGFEEFYSEIYVLSFARHKNIVMLLGYCCKENLNILVYEYICNNSLEWHLFDNNGTFLEWHQRRAIAIGTAKGLRFLHEECRGAPIIHRDLRPGNILLTHDFVPMLGDFGLAKWKTTDDSVHTRILGTLGYLAPEYAENGLVSVRTDVYAYGMVLLQLISGSKVVDPIRHGEYPSLRQWAKPLIKRLALHELVDPRIEESYDTYELYQLARTAYLCVQKNPEKRPSMGEVVLLLEGESDHLQHLKEHFIPHHTE